MRRTTNATSLDPRMCTFRIALTLASVLAVSPALGHDPSLHQQKNVKADTRSDCEKIASSVQRDPEDPVQQALRKKCVEQGAARSAQEPKKPDAPAAPPDDTHGGH